MTTSVQPPAQPILMASADDGEELQRAELYGLLARLWYAPPDEALKQQFAVAVTEAPDPGSFLETPWQDLVAAMRATSLQDATVEYNLLFLGTGKAEVFLYASFHLKGGLNETPLVELRTELSELGLSKDLDSGETEDHVSFVLEVMRYLIAGEDIARCNLERQRRFFRAHVQPWIGNLLCEAVEQHPRAALYAALARFTRAFVEVETQGFDMIE